MPIRRNVALAAAIVSSTAAGAALPTASAHADAGTLYVNNASAAHCSDSGTGTQAQPFCTMQAAADAAQPGQTVSIAAGSYGEQVTLRHSGSPGNTITFEGGWENGHPSVFVGAPGPTTPHAIVATGVHDITLRNLSLGAHQEAVLVTDSDHITVEHDVFRNVGRSDTSADLYPAIRLTGKTTAATVSRNRITNSGTAGVVVDPTVAGSVITTNIFDFNGAGGVVVTDAPGTVITSNTFVYNCGRGIVLAGASSGATIENNIATMNNTACPGVTSEIEFLVSPGSTPGTKADYNVIAPANFKSGYSWGGSSYESPAAFNAATGQGAHDLGGDTKLSSGVPTPDSTATDSADANAPGELTTDIDGNPRVDNPIVANTGTGVGYYDRGATEVQDSIDLAMSSSAVATAAQPLDTRLWVSLDSPWSEAAGTLDFGDGTTAALTPAGVKSYSGTVTHTYPGPGTYQVRLTAADGLGATKTSTGTVVIPDGPPSVSLNVAQGPWHDLHATATRGATYSPLPVNSTSFDFGDGTPATVVAGPGDPGAVPHDYAARGLYTATVSITDSHGQKATGSRQVEANASLPGDIAVAGKWGVGSQTTTGIFNSGSWLLRGANEAGPQQPKKVAFGDPGDLPAVGDWQGVGHDQLGIYRQGVFALRFEDGSALAVPFGQPGDVPVPGLWDHNGHAQLAIYRPSIATFAVRHDDGSVSTATFGNPGDIPVVGDWGGVGHTQMGIYRPGISTFALRYDDGWVRALGYGMPGDQPIIGDWLGDWRYPGRVSIGIYRPATATFAESMQLFDTVANVFQLY